MSEIQPKIRQRNTWPQFARKCWDAVAIVMGLAILINWLPEFNSKSTMIIGLVAMGLFSVIAEFLGLYRNWQGIPLERETTCTLIAWGGTLFCLCGLGHFSLYSTELSGPALLLWFGLTPVFSLAGRIVLRTVSNLLIDWGVHSRGFAVIGVNDLGITLVRNIVSSPELGLRFLGFFDDRPAARTGLLPDELKSKLGGISELVDFAKKGQVQVVFITMPMRAEKRIRDLIHLLADTTASVYIVPDLFVFQLLHSRWTDIQGLPVVSVFENPFYGIDGILKRSFDIVLATIAIVIALIPMAVIALAIKITSRGPVLFFQRRYGLDGKEIVVWKFRTMTVCEDGELIKQATAGDHRITGIGGFLRRSSLDELPQLFNVLAGRMSIVGPRPHANAHNEYYRKQIEGYMLRHKVRPGITGLAQVNGCRGETETLDKMERRVVFDHQYIREWSFWLDVRILLRTASIVLSRQNAY